MYAVVIHGSISYRVVGTDSDGNEAVSTGAVFNNKLLRSELVVKTSRTGNPISS